jgi:membrane protease YdiL (CAAX protease family)
MENVAYPRIKNAILLCLLLIGIQVIAGLVGGLIFGLFRISTESLIYGVSIIIVNLLSFALVVFIGFKKSKLKFNEVFKFNKVSLDYWLAIIVFMIGFIIVMSEIDNFFSYLLPMPDLFNDIFGAIMVEQTFIISIILIGIVPAFTEEMLFRGVILNGFKRNYSDKKAILISALFFGLVHLNPWQFLTAFLIGIAMAWIYIKTESIILCIYMHLFNNMMSLIALRYSEVLPISGFSTAYSEKAFQPIWFDLIGIIMTAVGILLIIRAARKSKSIVCNQTR